MKKIKIGGLLEASELSLGCWRTASLEASDMTALLNTAYECGIDFYDTANIYGGGISEILLGKAVKELNLRNKIKIQTKCAIHDGLYDFSKEHILKSVDESLERLDTDYIDVLLLHRPDTLMEPEEVAEAFDTLYNAGKVRLFGVSNQNPMQISLLQKYTSHKIIANQLQFSLANSSMIDCGINVNMEYDPALMRDGGILEYCRLNDITIQAWSPLQYGVFEGTFLENYEKFPELNKKLDEYSEKYCISKAAVAFAWILRHPAKIQPITGTTSCERIKEISKACDIKLSREEWYDLYKSAGNRIP